MLQFGNANLIEMEYTCSKGGIGVPIGKYIEEMLLGTAATGGDDRNLQPVGELIEGVAGKALLHPIVVHAGEKNLAGTAYSCPSYSK